MTSYKQIKVQFEEANPQKWCVPLKEDVFVTFMNKGNSTTHKADFLCEGSLFSPLLFGKFFDPSDAFPLWEFDSDVLLSNARSSNQCTVDWSQTETDYLLRAEIPGVGKGNIRVCVEDGKVLVVSGQLRQQKEDWRAGNWWEYGCVRRIELPENADWRKTEAFLSGDHKFLQVKIPKTIPTDDVP
ncbi:PREDICTED: 21.7 kDa class VI heat shock protein [Nicotiana attenuata]|uniref:21.7 kDa class vi heat shock protein n=1 Tax=Nicotiana attenuata TaxID=49451 RepID=A0A314KMH2_NICAT|nr:PREDICTED: 21.7 kDa class VI heat shock protein [Nicotiana attenuata]OIT30510.1 21.7 kda class vi heat shock protein [Nicotiana attenuata]